MMLPDELFGLVTRHRPIVCIDLLVRDQAGRLLVGLRKNRPAQGTWFVPGGNVRKNERLDQAFKRISLAELGTAFARSDARFAGVFEHFYPDNSLDEPDYGTHNIALAYELSVDRNAVAVPPDQHSDIRWIANDEALADPLVNEYTKDYCR